MNTSKRCGGCQQPLGADAPDGLCPECLLKAGLGSGVDIGPESQGDSGPPPVVAPTPAEVARLFPQLEILGFIGQGGMGVVYKARQRELERVVALKILPPGIGRDPAFAERFTREAKALAKLNHAGVVTLYEFGKADGSFFFLMEFVDGVSLGRLLERGRISTREALAIVPQICDALQYAHDQGIVHRDIKPENILLDRLGRVKVADFGLAKLVGTEALTPSLSPPAGAGDTAAALEGTPPPAALTEAGKVMGTPLYMAPEQREHPTEVDHRADIYSLGVVFYQMLTGELPGKPITLPSRKVQVDVRLDEVVLRALENEPERRYQQVSQVKTAVETIAQAGASPSANAPAARDAVPRQIQVAAIGLLAAGLLTLEAVVLNYLFAPQLTLAKSATYGLILLWFSDLGSALVLPGLTIVGALKMKRLESFGWGLAAACLSIVPSIRPFLTLLYAPMGAVRLLNFVLPAISLALGLWALLVLSRPEVRAVFRSARAAPAPRHPRLVWPWGIVAVVLLMPPALLTGWFFWRDSGRSPTPGLGDTLGRDAAHPPPGVPIAEPAEIQEIIKRLDVPQETAGIGVALATEGENVVVKRILPDSAAAGSHALGIGDRLLAVAEENGPPVPVTGLSLEAAVRLIRGPKGTTVRLTFVPAGPGESQARTASFVRGELQELARWGDGVPLPEGMPAPNIPMLSLPGGATEHLTNFAGKIVVLEFWATWCGPCQQHLADFQRYPEKHPEWKDKVVVIAASVDEDAQAASKHLRAKGWDKTHNVWVGREAIKAYHVNRLPTTYMIDQQGRIAADDVKDIPKILERVLTSKKGEQRGPQLPKACKRNKHEGNITGCCPDGCSDSSEGAMNQLMDAAAFIAHPRLGPPS